MTTYPKDDVAEAECLAILRKLIKPGREIYTAVTHEAQSGMSRSIELYLIQGRDDVRKITYHVARVLSERIDQRNGGVIVTGCGMDMCFGTVYRLGQKLWPNGTSKPHGVRNGAPDTTGGYAIKARDL
jgi:hypothetical protein